jgi:hypothetical protein
MPHSLSASSYLRRLGLAIPLQSTIDQRAILDLVKINADLGRFGGLIKMWLTTNDDLDSLSAEHFGLIPGTSVQAKDRALL